MLNSPETLVDIYEAVWKKLETAASTRHEGWHLVTVGTIRNQQPELRTTVLRGADRSKSLLWFHTDLRSPKAEDIRQNPRGSLLFYCPSTNWQLRLSGSFALDSDSPQTSSSWNKTSTSAKRCYQGPFSPSSASETPSTNLPEGSVGPEIGRENFCRVLFQIDSLEWLALSSEGHKRAKWHLKDSGFEGTWLNP